jgi:filamentous hemagglutinin
LAKGKGNRPFFPFIIVAAYFTGGAALEAYASAAGSAATSGYAAATISAEAWAVEGAALSFSASAAAASSVAGGAIAGAAGGFAGAFIGSDLNVRAGEKGAVTGALSGGINNYYGSSYTAGRILANGMAGGAGAVLRGESFSSGFRTSAIISSLAYLNSAMRAQMVTQSNQTIENNGSGLSAGMYGSGEKLAGGRFFVNANLDGDGSVLGGWQSRPGTIFGFSYTKGGFVDMVMESFAGPHDYANAPTWYDKIGNAVTYPSTTSLILEWTTNYSTSLIFAAPFSAAAILEQSYSTSSVFEKKKRP